jgi:hypothetical protein
MAQGFPMQTCLLMAGIAAVTATIYFWLLNRFEDQLIWWPIAIIGVLIVAAPTLLSFFVNYSYLR